MRFGAYGVGLLLLLAVACAFFPKPEIDSASHTVTPKPHGTAPLEITKSLSVKSLPEDSSDSVCRDLSGLEAQAYGEVGDSDTWYAEQARIVDVLSESSTSEHLHAAALVTSDPNQRIALMTKALSINPMDPVLLWGAVQMCGELQAATECPLNDWEQRLIEVDSENTEAWVRIAVHKYAAGNVPGAFAAMQRASSASQSKGYWPDYIEVMMRGFAATTSEPFASRVISAVNISAQHLPRAEPVLNMCREQAAVRPLWGETCLTYGRLLERQGKTDYAVAIARAVQLVTYEAIGDTVKAEVLKTRRDAERAAALRQAIDYDPSEDFLVFSTPKLFWAYLSDLRSQGESAALRIARGAARERMKSRPELRCTDT